jgi:hypothetical protein
MPPYSYSTRKPSPVRYGMEESTNPPGHRMGMKVRRDKLIPGPAALDYQSYCTCKWKQGQGGPLDGPSWVRPKANAVKYFNLHINRARKQGVLL